MIEKQIIIRFIDGHFSAGRYLVVSVTINILIIVGQILISSKWSMFTFIFASFGVLFLLFLVDLFSTGSSLIASTVIVCSTLVTIIFQVKNLEAGFKQRDIEEYYRSTGRRVRQLD